MSDQKPSPMPEPDENGALTPPVDADNDKLEFATPGSTYAGDFQALPDGNSQAASAESPTGTPQFGETKTTSAEASSITLSEPPSAQTSANPSSQLTAGTLPGALPKLTSGQIQNISARLGNTNPSALEESSAKPTPAKAEIPARVERLPAQPLTVRSEPRVTTPLYSPPQSHHGPAHTRRNADAVSEGNGQFGDGGIATTGRSLAQRQAAVGASPVTIGLCAACLVIGFLASVIARSGGESPQTGIWGIALSESGAPYGAGAVVRLPGLNRSTTTDEEGFFRFDEVPVGKVTIEYSLPESMVGTREISVSGDAIALITLSGATRREAPVQSDVTTLGDVEIRPTSNKLHEVDPTIASEIQANHSVGGLNVSCNVGNATVTIDDRAVGEVNQTFRRVPTGDHRITVAKDGYQSFSASIQVDPNKITRLNVSLSANANDKSAAGLNDPNKLYLSARDDFASGNPDAALLSLEKALARDPGLADAYLLRGEILGSQGDTKAAAIDFVKAGEIYDSQKRLQSAKDAFGRAAVIDPASPLANKVRGDFLQREGAFGEAILDYEAALKIARDYFPAQMGLGVALYRRGDYRRADKELRKAKVLNSKDPYLYHYLMLNSLAKNDISEVNKTFGEFRRVASTEEMQRFANDNSLEAVRRVVMR